MSSQKNNIDFVITSDVELDGVETKEISNDGFIVEPLLDKDGLSIVGEYNCDTDIKSIVLRGAGRYKGKVIKAPKMAITQDPHPIYYISETSANRSSFGEDGGLLEIYAYALQDGNPTRLTKSENFEFSIIEGDCSYDEPKTVEGVDSLVWSTKIRPNKEIKEKYLKVRVSFFIDKCNKSVKEFSFVQDAHVQILTSPVFDIYPKEIPNSSGTTVLRSYYTVDGVASAITPSIVSSTFDEGDYSPSDFSTMSLTGSGQTITFKENVKDNSKSLSLKIKNPINGNDMVIGPVVQKATSPTIWYFSFSDNSSNKNYSFPYKGSIVASGVDKDGYVKIGVISKKVKGDAVTGVTFTAESNDNNVVVSVGTDFIKFKVNERSDGGEEDRPYIITLTQDNGGVIPYIPSLTISITQFGIDLPEPPKTGIPFDYMIFDVACDMLSGRGLDIMVCADGMPPTKYDGYEKEMRFVCVGRHASKIVSGDTSLTPYPDTGEVGNAFTWAGVNVYEYQSVTVSPKKFLTDEFIKDEISVGNTSFEFGIYANFSEEKYTGVCTFKSRTFKKGENGGVDYDTEHNIFNPYSGDTIYKPDKVTSSTVSYNELEPSVDAYDLTCNVMISTCGKENYKTYNNGGYTKIGIVRYNYLDGTLKFEQNKDTFLVPNNSGKDEYEKLISGKTYHLYMNIEHSNNLNFGGESIFGSMYGRRITDSNNAVYEMVDFVIPNGESTMCINIPIKVVYEFSQFWFYYDQTKYKIYSIGISVGYQTVGGEVKPVPNWVYNGDAAYNKTGAEDGFILTTSGNPEKDSQDTVNELWLNVLGKFEIPTNNANYQMNVKYTLRGNHSSSIIPTVYVGGTFRRYVNGIPLEGNPIQFAIGEGTPYSVRPITWKMPPMENDYLMIDGVTDLGTDVRAVGFATYSDLGSTDTVSYTPSEYFVYNYNENLLINLDKLSLQKYARKLTFYVIPENNMNITPYIEWGFSDSNLEDYPPTTWHKPTNDGTNVTFKPISTPSDWNFDVIDNLKKRFLWVRVWTNQYVSGDYRYAVVDFELIDHVYVNYNVYNDIGYDNCEISDNDSTNS